MNDFENNFSTNNDYYFLNGSGDIRRALREADWSQNALGHPKNWSTSLRTTLGMLLGSKVPMILWWGDEMIQFCNDSCVTILTKIGKIAAVGNRAEEFWSDSWHSTATVLQKLMQSGQTVSFEEKQSKFIAEGKEKEEYFFCNFSYSPVFGDTGKVEGVLGIFTDTIADRTLNSNCPETDKSNEAFVHENESRMDDSEGQESNFLSEQKLKKREQQIRSIVDSAPFPIGVYEGTDMKITLANQSIIDVWGKGSDIVGKTYFDVLPELKNQDVYPKLLEVFSEGKPYHARNQRVDLKVEGNLKPFYFNYSFTPLFDEAGKVYGVMNTAADVTDLNLAKFKLEQTQQNFRNLILQAPVCMCLLLGPSHIVEVANDSMVNLWGKNENDVMNKPIFEALPDAKEQGLEALLDHVFNAGETFTANEMPVHLIRFGVPDIVYQNFIYEPYRDGSGEILGVIAISNDVTNQVLAMRRIEEIVAVRTEQLESANASLSQSNTELAQFAYIASHDLQEPLRKISIFSQLLESKLGASLDVKSQLQLRKINQSAERMQALVKDVLAYSQLNKAVDEFVKVNLNHIVKGILDDMELLIEQKDAKINISELPVIPGQPLQLTQLLSNLIGNSLKFHSPDASPCINIESFGVSTAEKELLALNANADYAK